MKKFGKQSKFRTIQSFFNSRTTNNGNSNNSLVSHETTVSQSDLTIQTDSTFPTSQRQEQISLHSSESSQLLSPSGKQQKT
jgi:hypothetical protein